MKTPRLWGVIIYFFKNHRVSGHAQPSHVWFQMALTAFQLPLFCLLPTHLIFIFIASISIKHFQLLPHWCHCPRLHVHSILNDCDHVQNKPHGLPLFQTLPHPVEEARNPGFIPQRIFLFPYPISNLSRFCLLNIVWLQIVLFILMATILDKMTINTHLHSCSSPLPPWLLPIPQILSPQRESQGAPPGSGVCLKFKY